MRFICDRCRYRYNNHNNQEEQTNRRNKRKNNKKSIGNMKCQVCNLEGGLMKKIINKDGFVHLYCGFTSDHYRIIDHYYKLIEYVG